MSAEKLFNDLFGASLVTMLITLVASLGMTFSVGQILAPVKRLWLLLATIVVNLVLGPLIAIGVCHALLLSKEAAIGGGARDDRGDRARRIEGVRAGQAGARRSVSCTSWETSC